MSKRTVFTTITPIPNGVSRETVMSTLRSHVEMIDLNPLVIERFPVKAPSFATPEEFHSVWYEIVDRVAFLPGGMAASKVHYNAVFHDLPEGLQTHVYAPMGLDIRSRWLLGGNLPGEPAVSVEMGLGIPKTGLYLREDVDMKCNIMMVSFVRKTLKKAHGTLVDRLMEKAKLVEVGKSNASLGGPTSYQYPHRHSTSLSSNPSYSPTASPSMDPARLSTLSSNPTGASSDGRQTPGQHFASPQPQYAQIQGGLQYDPATGGYTRASISQPSSSQYTSSQLPPYAPPAIVSPHMLPDPAYQHAAQQHYYNPQQPQAFPPQPHPAYAAQQPHLQGAGTSFIELAGSAPPPPPKNDSKQGGFGIVNGAPTPPSAVGSSPPARDEKKSGYGKAVGDGLNELPS